MNNAEAKMPRISHKLKAQLNMHSMMIPALVFAIVFAIFPLVGLIMAFQDYPSDKTNQCHQ